MTQWPELVYHSRETPLESLPLEVQALLKEFNVSEGESADVLAVSFVEGMLRAGPGFELYFDWSAQIRHFKKRRPVQSEPFARAVKLKNTNYRVVDASCGTGKDALYLASLGAKVLAFERHPLIALLLADAKRRVCAEGLYSDVAQAITLQRGEARDHFFSDDWQGAALYFDPMYDQSSQLKSKSRPKKQMHLFQQLFERSAQQMAQAQEIEQMMKWFQGQTFSRFILKRPDKHPIFRSSHLRYETSFRGSTTRYDLYLR